MKTLDSEQLVFPQTTGGKFILYSKGFKVGEIELPSRGLTFFPPEPDFSDEQNRHIIRIRFDFLDNAGMRAVREALNFFTDDPTNHILRLVIPGEEPRGITVEPHGRWRSWFLDDVPQGYGPVEATFITTENPKFDSPAFSDTEPWVVE
ncbi:hypothetical protein DRQ33_02990 [bacterium]|nr:MAG: hypothetical protein DRQ33_02990 [bacterium]